MLQLTSSEVSTLPTNTNVYEGVGKMYDSFPNKKNYSLATSSLPFTTYTLYGYPKNCIYHETTY